MQKQCHEPRATRTRKFSANAECDVGPGFCAHLHNFRTKVLAAVSAIAVGFTAAFGGTWAYMTNTQNATNVFTAGEVKIKLTEPDWPGNNSKEVEEITPNQEIPKNPQITNTGTTSAVVFAEVEIPVDKYDIATAGGDRQGETLRELFWMKTKDTAIQDFKNTIHDEDGEWNWLQSLCYYKDADGNLSDEPVSGGSVVHVFGYGTVLDPQETTVPIFDKVQLKNIVLQNGKILPSGEDLQIDIRAFAIQGSYVLGDDSAGGGDLTLNLSAENLIKIFERYCNQNGYKLGTGNVHKDEEVVPGETKYKITLTGDGVAKKNIYTDKNGTISGLTSPIRNGYTFDGWYNEETKVKNGDTVDKDTTLMAKWEPIKYSITYDLAGGTNNSANPEFYTIESDDIAIEPPIQDGFTFDGWIVNDNEQVESYTIVSGSTGNINLAAVWSKADDTPTYAVTVTFDINNSEIELPNKVVTTMPGKTVSYTPDEDVYSEKYTFDGWYTKAEGGEKLSEINPAENMTVYAHWTKIQEKTYKVTMDACRPDGAPDSEVITIKEGNSLGDSIKDKENITGYTWAGWNTKKDGTGDAVTSKTIPNANITCYGIWKPINYSITYDLAGGTNNESNPSTYTIESGNISIAAPAQEGFTFDGWIVNGGEQVESYTIVSGSTGDVHLAAVWSKTDDTPSYAVTVTFNINNSNIGLANKTVTTMTGKTVSYIPNDSVYKGKYTFDGWYTKPEGGEKVDSIVPTESMTVYGHWTKIKDSYTVTFDYQNPLSTGVTKTVLVTEGDSIGNQIPEDGSASGYKWIEWNTKVNGTGTTVNASTVPTGSMTAYGIWEIVNYKITYDLAGGKESTANPTSYTVEDATFTISVPTKENYIFSGWQVNGSTETVNTYTVSKGSVGNITLKAVWEKMPDPKTYTVTFHMGYTDETTSMTRSEGTAFGNVATPSWKGHTFDGWYTKADGGDKVTSSTVITSNLDVYAHWTSITYAISYNYNGGSVSENNPESYTTETRSDTKIVYPTKSGYALTKVTITGKDTGEVFTKTGDDLSGGWRTGLGEPFAEDVTVTFSWTAKPFEISFNTSAGTFADGSHENILTVQDGKKVSGAYQIPTRDGYTFTYWFATKDGVQTQVPVNSDGIPTAGVTEDMVLSAYWTGNIDTVTYNANGGTFAGAAKTNKVSYVAWNISSSSKYEEPTREGYTFTGWYTDSTCKNKAEMNDDGNGPKTFGTTGSTYTYYAGWKANTYTITYNLAGGKLAAGVTNPATYTPDNTVTIVNPEKDDYIFLGWSEDGGTTYTRDLVLSGAVGDKTLTAVWEKDNSVIRITYDLAGGEMQSGASLPTKVARTEDAFMLGTPTKAGFIFDGWQKTGNSTPVKSLTIDPKTESSDIMVTAVWHEQQTFTITYMPENGAASQSKTVKEGEPMTSLATATWPRYTFDGWYTEKDGGEKVTEETIVTSDMTLYGHWTTIIYNIAYNYNDGAIEEGKTNPATFTAKDSATIYYPVRPGYKLIKVTYASTTDSYVKTGEDMSGYTSTGLGKAFDGDIVVTFEWQQVPFTVTYHTTSGSFDDGAKENVVQVQDGAVVSGTYKVPTREGYVFSKWFLSGDTSQSEVAINEDGIPASGVTEDMDLYVYWMADVYAITYDMDGGSFQGAYKTQYTIATGDFTLQTPVKAGYSFAGWTGSNGDDPQTEVTIATGSTGNRTYKANWIQNYTVTFYPENGTENFTVTVRDGDTLNTLPAEPQKDGYTFTGWYVGENKDTLLTTPYSITGDMSVYAGWEKIKKAYTVSLSLNDGEMADKSISAVTDDDGVLSALADPTRDGYTFTGWYTDVNLTNKAVFPITFTQDGTLFAGWTENKVVIPVVLSGESALGVQVKFEGAAAAEDMTYKLSAADDATRTAIANGQVAITSDEAIVSKGQEIGTSTISFGDVSILETGEYKFSAALSNISAPEGWTYDLQTKSITVVVTKTNGKLTATVNGNNPLFTNSYEEPKKVSVVLKGDTALKANIAVSGKDAEEIFSLKIEGADEATRNAILAGTVTLASDTATSGYKLESDEVKTVVFGDISITEIGTYNFKVSETNASPSDELWTYANTEADAQIITVNVEKSGSAYSVSIANNGPYFLNNYGKNISTPVTLSGDKAAKVYVEATGANSNEVFTFKISPLSQTTKDAVNAGIITMAGTTASSSGSINAGSRETITFGDIVFNRTGTYTFSIKETNTSVPENWTYANTDADAVTMTVTITKDLATNRINYEVSYDNTVFVNSYSAPVVRYVTPQQYGAVENDSGDDTAAFNAALTAMETISTCEKVYVPAGTYKINATNGNGIRLKSGSVLEMAEGAVLEVIANDQQGYDCIIASSVNNATVKGGKIVGDRESHDGTEGEWGHGIGIYDSQHVTITGTRIDNCWGDGVYIGTQNQNSLTAKSTNIELVSVTANNNRRNGLSIVAGDNITVNGCLFANTNGHNPQYGIDIETNHWKDGDKSSNNDIIITNTTCTGNVNGSIGFVSWCSNVTLTSCTMNGPIYNQMGQDITLSNTAVLGSTPVERDSVHALNRGLIMTNGSYFDGGYSANADTCVAEIDMSTENAKALNGYNYSDQGIGSAIVDDTNSSSGKALYLLRQSAGTKEAGAGYALSIVSEGSVTALTAGKQYRVEITAKANNGTEAWINNQTDYECSGGFAYPWAINVAEQSKLGSLYNAFWSFCPEPYYTTFCRYFTANGTENALWVYDLSKAANSGLYIESIKLYEVN